MYCKGAIYSKNHDFINIDYQPVIKIIIIMKLNTNPLGRSFGSGSLK